MKTETLDPDARYLLCRPLGGFNDTMVQLEYCRRHAVRFGRTLIVDFSRSGLRLPFDDVFVPNDGFGCPVIPWSADIAATLDGIESVLPAGLAGRISTFETIEHEVFGSIICKETGEPVSFDMHRDHAERLLVHEKCGGGLKGVHALQRLALVPPLADEIAARLAMLGGDYDAIHVRNSDITTDYRRLFFRCRRLVAGRRVLVCSDSAKVKAEAERILDGAAEVLSAARVPDTGGKPLHLTPQPDNRTMVLDMLTDLLAIAGSRAYVFTRLQQRPEPTAAFSGFTLLGEMLRQQPAVVRGLLALAGPDLKRRLQTPPPRSPLTLARSFAELDRWRWNFSARRVALHCRLQAMRSVVTGATQRRGIAPKHDDAL